MIRFQSTSLFAIVIACAIATGPVPAQDSKRVQDSKRAPKVLIVSPTAGRAEGFRKLLSQHQIPVSVVAWEEGTAERAKEFDLVMVTGESRSGKKPLDVKKPILAIGPFGYGYYGRSDLKHGYPYS